MPLFVSKKVSYNYEYPNFFQIEAKENKCVNLLGSLFLNKYQIKFYNYIFNTIDTCHHIQYSQ